MHAHDAHAFQEHDAYDAHDAYDQHAMYDDDMAYEAHHANVTHDDDMHATMATYDAVSQILEAVTRHKYSSCEPTRRN